MNHVMDKKSIGIKIHDIHHGLIKSTGAVVETELDLLKSLGVGIQIASVIKDHEVIKDMTPFYAAAGELKISRALAKEGLYHLEALGFVRLKKTSQRQDISRIDITVPSLSKIYTDFGDYFESQNQSILAASTVSIIEKLSQFPHKEKDIVSQIGISPKDYDVIKDIGKTISIMDTYQSKKDSESVIYSPIYWDDNPEKIFEILETHSSENLSEALQIIRKYQGLSGDRLTDQVLIEAIKLGCFPTLSVNSVGGNKKFVFTPRIGVGKEEKTLIHKARVLLSCVRYGENFAGISKIISPYALINALAGKGWLKGHSEGLQQYESARNHGLVKIIPTGSRYEVHFIDNEENNKAVQMALDMLEYGQIPKNDKSQDIAKKILLPSSLNHPIQTRIHVAEDLTEHRSTSTVQKINDLIRGVNYE